MGRSILLLGGTEVELFPSLAQRGLDFPLTESSGLKKQTSEPCRIGCFEIGLPKWRGVNMNTSDASISRAWSHKWAKTIWIRSSWGFDCEVDWWPCILIVDLFPWLGLFRSFSSRVAIFSSTIITPMMVADKTREVTIDPHCAYAACSASTAVPKHILIVVHVAARSFCFLVQLTEAEGRFPLNFGMLSVVWRSSVTVRRLVKTQLTRVQQMGEREEANSFSFHQVEAENHLQKRNGERLGNEAHQ